MFVRHSKMTAWGLGIVLDERGGQRTVMFADGQKRAFKVAIADQFLVAAEPATEPERASFLRARQTGSAPRPVNLELEAQLTSFDDTGAFAVYADWLQQQGDPRGELIHAQLRRADAADPAVAKKAAAAEAKLLKAHAEVFVPAGFARKGDFALTWRCGFIAAARFDHVELVRDGEDKLATLLGHPSAMFLHELALTHDLYEPSPVRSIAASRHARLERIAIGSGNVAAAALAAGDIGGLFALPNLRALTITADALAVRAPIAHAKLATLALRFRRDDATTFGRLFALAAPALTRLTLACLYGFDGPPPGALAGVPNVAALELGHTTETLAWLQAIAAAPCAARLEHLALPDGDLADSAIPMVTALRAKFPALRTLDLSNNHLSEQGERLLASFAAEVRARGKPAGERRAGPIRAVLDVSPAARELAVPARWNVVGYDVEREAAWGEYPGSKGMYAVFAERAGATGCNCPSFQRPCKHVQALQVMLAEGVRLEERAPYTDIYAGAQARRYESSWE